MMDREANEAQGANQLLAEALVDAKKAAKDGVLQSSAIDRRVRERLIKANCLSQIIQGWYLFTKPGAAGNSTAWFGGFWAFLRQYLTERFDKWGYCLSAESSLDLQAGDTTISKQVTVITKKASNQTVELPHDTSLLVYADTKNFPETIERFNGVNVMPLAVALCRLSPAYFENKPLNAEIGLKLVSSVSDISRVLLATQAVTAAGRIAGAYEALGDSKKAAEIAGDMAAAGLTIQPHNPFRQTQPKLEGLKLKSPYAGRIEAMWKSMRDSIIEVFPTPPGLSDEPEKSIRIIKEIYNQDAYHSLAIEGYQVTEDLIAKIASNQWHPETDRSDKDQRDALAAKGYFHAFTTVVQSIQKVLRKESPGKVFSEDLQAWYRDLFSASVQAGIVRASDLAGFRNNQVYIEHSRHVPPGSHSVVDSMETLYGLLQKEEHAGVRAVLGHFIFVFIHPYMDGNGRIGRFLMNLMLVSGGYNWTVIRTARRPEYMRSLEAASTGGDIKPFATFVASELDYWKNFLKNP